MIVFPDFELQVTCSVRPLPRLTSHILALHSPLLKRSLDPRYQKNPSRRGGEYTICIIYKINNKKR